MSDPFVSAVIPTWRDVKAAIEAAASASDDGVGRVWASLLRSCGAPLLDTWDAVLEGSWDTALIFIPVEAAAECAALARRSTRPPLLTPQEGEKLGARMSAAFASLFAAGTFG